MTLDSLIADQPTTSAAGGASRRRLMPGYDDTMPEAKLLSADVEPAVERDDATDEALVEDDLLVEDVSIDGMCGVY
jgi:mycofactocin precursor